MLEPNAEGNHGHLSASASFIVHSLCRHHARPRRWRKSLGSENVPGASNIVSVSSLSQQVRKPLAPVPMPKLLFATSRSAPRVNRSSTPLSWKSCSYCRIRLFLGSVSTRTRASSSRADSAADTGMRPTSSGIRP